MEYIKTVRNLLSSLIPFDFFDIERAPEITDITDIRSRKTSPIDPNTPCPPVARMKYTREKL